MASPNRYYNDPAIGQAMSNLAGLFAPPSGGDLSGYATAAATKEKAARMAELFNYAKDPNYDQTQADRLGVLAGLYSPDQSYYSVDQANDTSRANNSADNARALMQTTREQAGAFDRTVYVQGQENGRNTADNAQLHDNNVLDNQTVLTKSNIDNAAALARQLLVQDRTDGRNAADNAQIGANNVLDNQTVLTKSNIDNAGALTRQELVQRETNKRLAATNQKDIATTLLSPVAEGATRFVPPAIASLFGTDPQQSGNVSVGQGEKVVAADGRTIMGQPKPLSLTELDAQEKARLIKAGIITDQELHDGITGAQAPVKVVDAAGNVTWSTPGAATRDGKTAYVDPGTVQKVENGQIRINGEFIPVVQRPGESVWRRTDGTVIPSNIQVARQPTITGTNDDVLGGPTTANLTQANNLKASLDGAEYNANTVLNILAENPNAAGVPARIKGVAQSLFSSFRQVSNAYADTPETALISSSDAKSWIEEAARATKGDKYDPDVVRVASLISDMAYARAQISNPQGEVSRQAYDRAIESLGQGLFSSQEDLSTAMRAFLTDTIKAGRVKEQSLRGGSAAVDTSGSPAGALTADKAPAPAYKEGDRAVNKQTGAVAVFRNGKWVTGQ